MNPRTLPVKRRPAPHRFFKRIHAVTRHRNQRVAASATAEELEDDDHSTRISRGFTIIFVIHVVAIALYFIHLNFLNDHSVAQTAAATTETASTPQPRIANPPMIAPDDATCIVVAGDNYSRIAAREGVAEDALRAANNNKPVAAGLTLKLPPNRIVAMDPPVVVALRQQTPSNADRGLVEAVPFEAGTNPRAQVVRPKVLRDTTTTSPRDTTTAKAAPPKAATTTKTATREATAPKAATVTKTAATRDTPAPKAAAATATRSYVVRPGDNLYRISKRYKIDQAELMRANSISDPGKLNTGATLVIPH
jgi:LysM repeat protein